MEPPLSFADRKRMGYQKLMGCYEFVDGLIEFFWESSKAILATNLVGETLISLKLMGLGHTIGLSQIIYSDGIKMSDRPLKLSPTLVKRYKI